MSGYVHLREEECNRFITDNGNLPRPQGGPFKGGPDVNIQLIDDRKMGRNFVGPEGSRCRSLEGSTNINLGGMGYISPTWGGIGREGIHDNW